MGFSAFHAFPLGGQEDEADKGFLLGQFDPTPPAVPTLLFNQPGAAMTPARGRALLMPLTAAEDRGRHGGLAVDVVDLVFKPFELPLGGGKLGLEAVHRHLVAFPQMLPLLLGVVADGGDKGVDSALTLFSGE